MTPDSPFDPTHSSRSFVETTGMVEALQRLDRGLGTREPFLVITGDPGTGKTALAHESAARWGTRVAAVFLAYPSLTGSELLEEILRRLGAEPPEGANRSRLVALLERTIGEITSPGQVAVVVVDDAHRLSAETLEELMLLVNAAQQAHRLIEVVLIGLPALEARLEEPAFATLRQRVSARVRLAPLSAGDTERYIQHRLTVAGSNGPETFPGKACREVARWSKGVPRQINALAAEALRRAEESGAHSVAPAHVQSAASALWGMTPATAPEAAAVTAAVPATAPPPPAVTEKPVPPPAIEAKPAPPPTVLEKPAPRPAVLEKPAPPPRPVSHEPAADAPAPPKPSGRSVDKPVRAPAEEPLQTYGPTVTSHDPHEWVKRFIGDKGPVQIGSHVDIPTWDLDYLDARPAAPAGGEQAPPPKPRKRGAKPRGSRPRSAAPRLTGRIATVAAASVAIIVVVGLLIRAGGSARNRAGRATTVSATADSAKAVVSRDARPARTAASDSKRPYTLEVGNYRDMDTAYDERSRLQALTGIEGWVVSPGDDGPQTYRVVLGVYRSQNRATAAANMLMNSRTLRRVTVVTLPPRSSRN